MEAVLQSLERSVIPVVYCDVCGCEPDRLYDDDGVEKCLNCYLTQETK